MAKRKTKRKIKRKTKRKKQRKRKSIKKITIKSSKKDIEDTLNKIENRKLLINLISALISLTFGIAIGFGIMKRETILKKIKEEFGPNIKRFISDFILGLRGIKEISKSTIKTIVNFLFSGPKQSQREIPLPLVIPEIPEEKKEKKKIEKKEIKLIRSAIEEFFTEEEKQEIEEKKLVESVERDEKSQNLVQTIISKIPERHKTNNLINILRKLNPSQLKIVLNHIRLFGIPRSLQTLRILSTKLGQIRGLSTRQKIFKQVFRL